jgi:hypothetical protein
VKYRNIREPGTTSYRSKRIELTPEDKEILRRRLARAEAYRRKKFPQFYRD